MTAPPTSPIARWAAPALAFVAGFVDTCGFIALFGLFTAHVTGNFVVIGASLVDQRSGLLTKLLALPTFVLAVAITHVIMQRRVRAGRPNPRFALLLQSALLAAFMAAGIAGAPFASGDAPLAMTTGLLGVAAMGVQNAASRVPFKDLVPTTVMTGNTTQLVMDGVDLLMGGQATPDVRARFAKMGPVVLAFAIGAAAGAYGVARFGFACIALPVVILLAATAAWQEGKTE